ncbi:cell division protein FtsZ [Spiroplasma endosymbiont of Aspidapion aeneum]|uniref:cell division protein FtsZ n=1 Tax=Spiroplasma endosymbiont of Aspidapion aeneum TaxID=3066276 RepID=UPI00313E9DE4
MSVENFKSAVIKVIGVGGGGCNAVNRMYLKGIQGVDLLVCNTDSQALKASPVENKIIIGKQVAKGLGAGANPKIGEEAALESEKEIRDILKGSDLIFIACGMGGGTGTGAAPIVARIAKETGALVVAAVSKPFAFEGPRRGKFADIGVNQLKKHVDSLIVISNNKLLEILGEIPFNESFKEADGILTQAVQTISDLITMPGLINLDFADISTVLKGKGEVLFGIGSGEGEEKAIEAANKAVSSALLESSVRGAKDAIVNITGGPNCTAYDAYDAVDIITQAAGEELNIIFGFANDEGLGDKMIVSIIATGFDSEVAKDREKISQQQNPQKQSYQQQPIQQPIQQQNPQKQSYQQQQKNDEMDKNNNIPNSFVQNNRPIAAKFPKNETVSIDDTQTQDVDDSDLPTFLKNNF